jgi:hypothetical protein
MKHRPDSPIHNAPTIGLSAAFSLISNGFHDPSKEAREISTS